MSQSVLAHGLLHTRLLLVKAHYYCNVQLTTSDSKRRPSKNLSYYVTLAMSTTTEATIRHAVHKNNVVFTIKLIPGGIVH